MSIDVYVLYNAYKQIFRANPAPTNAEHPLNAEHPPNSKPTKFWESDGTPAYYDHISF